MARQVGAIQVGGIISRIAVTALALGILWPGGAGRAMDKTSQDKEARREIKVNLNEAEFRDRVLACWMGKNIGGTLGTPFEGKREIQHVSFYTNLKPGEPLPNDDLDLQLLWLKAMEEHGGRVDARILGEYWMKYVPVNWNEYGICKRNMRRGILPPVSGAYDNERWKHSNGAWIRSEIWASLAPGCPALAAKMAREDACVDHGAAEGTLAEIFTASLESAAYIERDRDKLIQIGLTMIPQECGLARSIRAAVAAKKAGKTWQEARLDVIQASAETNWFQAPRNVAYTMIGWLYGEEDFGKSLCIAINCGDDTDCTGATLGSIFGILYGTKGIPAKWSEPIGSKIINIAISGFTPPRDVHELTEHTVAMTKIVLAMNGAPVGVTAEPTDMRRAGELRLSDPAAAGALWKLSPYQVVWNAGGEQVTLDYQGDPIMEAGVERKIRVVVQNGDEGSRPVAIRLEGLQDGWKVKGLPWRFSRVGRGKAKEYHLSLKAPAIAHKATKMTLKVRVGGNEMAIPLTLIRNPE